jgi:MFS family permease
MKEAILQILSTYTPLKNRNLSTYISGQAISLIGTWMQMTAQSWLAWELTHSAAALGVLGMMGHGPFLFVGPYVGVIADRYDRRKILIYTQFVAMCLAFTLFGLVFFHLVRFWHVLVLAGILGTVTALDSTAQQAFLGDLTGVEQVRKAVVINNNIFQLSRMFGPMLAGFAIQGLGMASAFVFNGLSFIPVLISLWIVRAEPHRKEIPAHSGHAMKQIFSLIRNQPLIQFLFFSTFMMTFFGISTFQIMPAFVSRALDGDSKMLGFLLGVSGAGALVGSALVIPLTHQAKKIGRILFYGSLVSGVGLALVGMSTVVWQAMVTMFICSVGFPVVLTNIAGLIQTLVPTEMRARMVGV